MLIGMAQWSTYRPGMKFLRTQTTGLPGQVAIKIGRIDSRLNVPACAAPEAFLPNGSRAWGKTTVGVRCTVPAPWTIYIPATVQIQADYIVTATPLAQGQNIGPNDIAKIKGDLATLPAGIITDPAQVVGIERADPGQQLGDVPPMGIHGDRKSVV